ncbi:MAG: HupE/UreJ family protein [Robiginitomaculum sp.]|nr:HupE/UreJ family protein [Robiginitomaculum sp.]
MLATTSSAHELRPAYMSITQTGNTQYDILWKTPAMGEKQLALKANFPTSCAISNGRRVVQQSKFAIETWTLNCPENLRGQSLTIGGLDKTLTDVLVRMVWADGDVSTARLTPDKTRLDFAKSGVQGGVAGVYFLLGVTHILGGIDHLLFVLAVMLLIVRGRKLFFAITAFTLGHSITLVLASLDIIRLDPSLVEALIAMSIVLMAYEAVRRLRGISGLTLERPWVVTFSFGLLHGFGFAGALREIGLPKTDLPAALLFFNIGVEVGQLLFIAGIFALAVLPMVKHRLKPQRLYLPVSYMIGTLAVYWTLERLIPLGLLRPFVEL